MMNQTISKKVVLSLAVLVALSSGCLGVGDDGAMTDTSEEAITAGVWKGDVRVTIAATKNVVAHQITYTITVTNLGDDDARNVIISHTPGYNDGLNGMTIASVAATSATCTPTLVNNFVLSVACTPITLAVRATATVTVVVNNPGDIARTGSAQAMGITPDPVPANNQAFVSVP